MMSLLTTLIAAGSAMPCGTAQPATPAQVRHIVGRTPGAGERVVIGLASHDDENDRLAVFARRGRGWIRYDTLGEDQEYVARRSARDGSMMIWSWHTAGDAPQSFDNMMFDRAGRPLACNSLGFPAPINQPTYRGAFWAMTTSISMREAVAR